jgi:hypothetical protein
MTLTWIGATGANVDVYRNGSLLKTTPNDGRDSNGRNFVGPATYVFSEPGHGTLRPARRSTCRRPTGGRKSDPTPFSTTVSQSRINNLSPDASMRLTNKPPPAGPGLGTPSASQSSMR